MAKSQYHEWKKSATWKHKGAVPWDKLLDLLRESVIVQAVVTLCLVMTACYLVATGRAVPELLSSSLMLVLGFYFGSKVQQYIIRAAKEQGK